MTMAFIRTPLALVGYGLAVYFFRPNGSVVGPAAGMFWSTVSISAVNLISFALLLWRFRVEELSLCEVIGIRRGKILADIALGLVWCFLLYGLLMIGLVLSLMCLRGPAGFSEVGEFILGPNPDFSFDGPVVITIVSATVFPLLNPLVEELNYRGYSQMRLESALGSSRLAILISASGFGLQHIAFAMTVDSAIAYAAGFFLWGIGAGVIFQKQRRLFPVIVAHFISNLSFGLAPIYFSLSG